MEQLVRVQKCNEDGTAQVIHIRQSACSGDCHKCSGCGAAKETLIFSVQNPIGAKPGDMVVIQSGSGPVLAGAVMLYILPLLLFIFGYILGENLWQRGGLVGCVAFLLGIGCATMYDRLITKRKKTIYTITGFGKQA